MENSVSNLDEKAELESAAIREQIGRYTASDGLRACGRCKIQLSDESFMVSLMGNGLFCSDRESCLERTLDLLDDPGSAEVVRCEVCHRNLRGRDYAVMEVSCRILCADREDCQRTLAAIFED